MSEKAGLPDISSPTSKPFPHFQFREKCPSVFLFYVDCAGRAHSAFAREPVIVQICHHYVPCSDMPAYRRSHHAYRTGTCYQDVLPDKVKLESRVRCVSEGVKTGYDVVGYLGSASPDIRLGYRKILAQRPRSCSLRRRYRAVMPSTCKAVSAGAADDVSLFRRPSRLSPSPGHGCQSVLSLRRTHGLWS